MKITQKEYSALENCVKKKSNNEFPIMYRHGIKNLGGVHAYELDKLDETTLRKLLTILPSGRVHHVKSPFLHSARQKVKKTLLYKARPHLNADHWPKVFRKLNNNARAGLKDFGLGQIGVLHDRAAAVSLRGKFIWNENKFGPVIVMGSWSEISSAVGADKSLSFEVNFKDIYAGDVNAEFDRMYSPRGEDDKLPEDDLAIHVTYFGGAHFSVADTEGQVLLNAPRVIMQTAVSKSVGVLGNAEIAKLPDAIEATGAGLDLLDFTEDKFGVVSKPASKMVNLVKGDQQDKTRHTFIVGIYPFGEKSYPKGSKGSQVMSGDEFLGICRNLAGIS